MSVVSTWQMYLSVKIMMDLQVRYDVIYFQQVYSHIRYNLARGNTNL